MVETKSDKQVESINALKNANKHLADLFADLAKKDAVLLSQATQLGHVARQCGDIKVLVYVGANATHVTLKSFLETACVALNEARS